MIRARLVPCVTAILVTVPMDIMKNGQDNSNRNKSLKFANVMFAADMFMILATILTVRIAGLLESNKNCKNKELERLEKKE